MFKLLSAVALLVLLPAFFDHPANVKWKYKTNDEWHKDLVATGAHDPLATPNPRVLFGDDKIEFSPTSDGVNIKLNHDKAGSVNTLTIDLKDASRKVRRIFAVAKYPYIALAIERGVPDTMSFDYVMVFGRANQRKPGPIDWCPSRSLLNTPFEKRCNIMHVELPDGDTIAMTLQQLLRDSNGNYKDIDTHSFVNACPFPDKDGFMMDSSTNQYSGTLTRKSEKPAAK